MNKFKISIINHYKFNESKCSHENRNYTSFILRPYSGWFDRNKDKDEEVDIYHACKKCFDLDLESTFCGGAYIYVNLFFNDIDITDKHNFEQSFSLDKLDKLDKLEPKLKFYSLTKDGTVTFILRQKDFSGDYYEKFFYKRLNKWYNNQKSDKIINALNYLPKMDKYKLWNISIIDESGFDFGDEYMELEGYNPKD
jgi:hypothetical protein